MKISVVSPIYRAEPFIEELVERLCRTLSQITSDYEIILVNDASPDNSWRVIKKRAQINDRVIGINLSRNFGQHYAITAGLDHVSGDWIVVMDCDLQDQPEEILKLYSKSQEGYDIVLARRAIRQDSFSKKMFSNLFYKILSYLTGTTQDAAVANFGIYKRNVIDTIISLRESIRYFPTMVRWVGYNTTSIDINHSERAEGGSSYNFKKLTNLATDIILAYSDKPIRLAIKFGFSISAISILIALYYLTRWLLGETTVLGYTSLIISVWLLFGITISTLGIIGLYVGKTFEGVKRRPIYIVSERTKSDD